MREIVERFIGRYQVWRDQRVDRNPLNIPAVMVATAIAQSAYDFFVRHQFTLWAVAVTAADIAFLVLYFRKSPFAWLMLPIWGATILILLPFVVTIADRYPLRVTVLSACLSFVLGAGFIAWGFAIRRRYYSYIGYEPC
jgi:hypothetical protein